MNINVEHLTLSEARALLFYLSDKAIVLTEQPLKAGLLKMANALEVSSLEMHDKKNKEC